MTVKTGSAWAGTFVTLDATGALATPSTGPAGTLYVDGVANGATVTITGSNPYKFAVTLPSLTAGQRVDMYITATISSIATAGVVASAQADTVLISDVKTETAAIQADLDNPNQYKADVSGIPDAILAKVVVDTLTLKQVLKVLAAIEIGTTTGGGTASFTYTGKDGTTVQLTGVDENGNRTAVIVTPGA